MIDKYSILNFAKYFSSGILQNYLVFILAKKDFNFFSCRAQNIENIPRSDNTFAPTFINSYPLPDTKLNGHCLINNISIPKKLINLYFS